MIDTHTHPVSKSKLTAIIGWMSLLLSFMSACDSTIEQTGLLVSSPDQRNTVEFYLLESGVPVYRVLHDTVVLIDTSALGFTIRDQGTWNYGFELLRVVESSKNNTW